CVVWALARRIVERLRVGNNHGKIRNLNHVTTNGGMAGRGIAARVNQRGRCFRSRPRSASIPFIKYGGADRLLNGQRFTFLSQ
ncbi:MAG: hypothetical protein ACRELF_20750, partial [Gemmataceae bacterium]